MPDDDQLLWLEEDAVEEEPQLEQAAAHPVQSSGTSAVDNQHAVALSALEDELQRTRRELMDVRKELAAKTVQLSRKEVVVAAEKVAELAAHVSSEKDKQLASLTAHVEQLEALLSQKEEEIEESRRMYNAQKRALREALAAAAEAEAVERQADEARARTAVAQAVEDELEKLQHELALLQARYGLEMRARDTELQALKQELQAANTNRRQAVAAAEAALTEAWQTEVTRATEAADARIVELQAELSRVRLAMQEQARSGDAVALAGELAALNQQKVAIQREFEAFKEMATASSRANREDMARLLEENSNLKSRLAAKAFADVQAGFKPTTKVFTALHASAAPGAVAGEEPAGLGLDPSLWSTQLPALLARWERQRKGLLPALIIGSVVALFVLVAVVRAAAVTRSEHRGGLCFLAHLGITVGKGCNLPPKTMTVSGAAGEELGHLLDQAPRVHDVEAMGDVSGGASTGTAAAASSGGAAAHAAAAKAEARSSGATGSAGTEGGGQAATEDDPASKGKLAGSAAAAADSTSSASSSSAAGADSSSAAGGQAAAQAEGAAGGGAAAAVSSAQAAASAASAVAGAADLRGGGAGGQGGDGGSAAAGLSEEDGGGAAVRRRLLHWELAGALRALGGTRSAHRGGASRRALLRTWALSRGDSATRVGGDGKAVRRRAQAADNAAG